MFVLMSDAEEIAKAKPNLNVLSEYRRREAEFLDRAKDMESVTTARDAAKQRYDDLRKVRLDEFMAGFTAISAKLKEMYQVSRFWMFRSSLSASANSSQMITMGGNAEIELIDSMDPFSEGVVLSIMPPKKSWRAIANLSGGEKVGEGHAGDVSFAHNIVDSGISGTGLRPARVQANATLLHG